MSVSSVNPTVSSSSYPATAQLAADFGPRILVCRHVSGDPIYLSFDGSSDHLLIDASVPCVALPVQHPRVWCRTTGTSGAALLTADSDMTL